MIRKILLVLGMLQNKPLLTAKTISKVLIKRTLLPIIYLLDLIIPKKKNLWAFPVGPNNQWNGNHRAVFEATKEYKFIQKNIFTYITGECKNLGFDCKYVRSLKNIVDIYYLLRSGVIIIHHGSGEYFYKLTNKNRIIINLWHGILLKGISFTMVNRYTKKHLSNLSKETNVYDAVICSSKIDRIAMSSSFNLPYSKILITGLPRNDWLVIDGNELPPDLKNDEKRLKEELDGRKLILYAPTFRTDYSGIYEFSDDEMKQLKVVLNSNNYVLGIRAHINASSKFQKDDCDFLVLSQDQYIETQIILRNTDVLITDYSSIWIDFLLTKRPIIGFCYDWDDYMKDRGLLYDYNSIFPGPIAYNTNELIQALIQTLNGKISYEHQFKHQNSKIMFHEFDDGNASRRVIETILDMQRHSK